MVVDVKPHCFGMRLENVKFLDLTYCKRPRSKFIWLGRICELHNQDRRVTLFIEEEI
jgi:hypothetical protein